MTEFDKQEFWAALGRLYSTTLEQTKQIEALRADIGDLFQVARAHQDSILALRDTARDLSGTAGAHEKRLDRYEVTVQAILDELRKLRPAG